MSSQVQDANNLPWDPNCTRFPSIEKLPKIPDVPEGAAWVWGKDDQVRTETTTFIDLSC